MSQWTGIPVHSLDHEEKEKLVHLADRLHERVVGQDEAVNLVAQAVLRSRAGLDKRGQPIGSFLFLVRPVSVRQSSQKLLLSSYLIVRTC